MVATDLRMPNEYPIVFAVRRGDGEFIRVDTGLVARWVAGELVVPVDEKDVDDVLRIVVQTVRRETRSGDG